MIPSQRIGSGRKGFENEDLLDPEPLGAGPLAGRFAGKLALPLTSISFLLVCAFLFGAANVLSEGSVTPVTAPGESNDVRAAWIFGWLFLFAGVVFLFLTLIVWEEKRLAHEEAIFKTEPRDFDFDTFRTERVVEVIKVRCRYCGTLNEASAKNCIACGAAM